MGSLFRNARGLVVLGGLVLALMGGVVAVGASELHSGARWVPVGDSGAATAPHEGGGPTDGGGGSSHEPTATAHTEPSPTPAPALWAGKIASVDCAGGLITITRDNGQGSASAHLTAQTHFTLSGKAGSCSGLKAGAHVKIEARQTGSGWTALAVAQDDSRQSGGTGSSGDGSGTGGSGDGGGDSSGDGGGDGGGGK